MKKIWILAGVILWGYFMATVGGAAQTAPGDETISLNIEERPLSEVLALITKTTGHAFTIDDQWLDMPVSISVKATPLHKVLKLIFTDLSNAIIYQSNGNIKIIIYSETAEQKKSAASQNTESSSPAESESSEAAELETEASQETAPENETDRSANRVEEDKTQPAEEQQPTEEQSENTAQENTEEQNQRTEGGAD